MKKSKFEPCPPIDGEIYRRLSERVGRCHLDLRLGIEHDRESWVFGQGQGFFHIENWYSIHGLIRHALRLLLLHGRGQSNARRIEIRQNELGFDHLPEGFDGFKLLHISDLHLDIARGIPEAHIDALQRVGTYDICVMTGDYRNRTFGPYRYALKAMGQICEKIARPIYGVLGNHDTIRMASGLEELGVRMLLNEAVPIEKDGGSIWLAGIDDAHYYRVDNMEKATDPIPEGAVSILLSHTPEMSRQAAYARFDAMLCGHTHGGQICLPGGIPIMLNANAPRALCNGPWSYHGLQGYTSVGSGSCIVDVRLNCPPEMTVHTLRRLRPAG
jgi:predicted MPP superfamily phosphohydrolase